MSKRKSALEKWLKTDCGQDFTILQTMPSDASFRRYYRIHTPSGSYVAMDAEPPQEDCRPYVAIAKGLRRLGLQVPDIIYAEEEQGFLLLTDFGDLTYLKALTTDNVGQLYATALNALMLLQHCRDIQNRQIPFFTAEIMWQEWACFKEWFLGRLLDLPLGKQENKVEACYALLVNSAIAQPQVFMHRDYHSANLMVLPDKEVGILDFQDAFIGPVTYDAVSLLRDCYIAWPEKIVTKLALQYWEKLELMNVSADHFLCCFDLRGLQRHQKAFLIFQKNYRRDGNEIYLK